MSNDTIIQSELLDHKADNEQNLCQILSVQELSLLSDRSNTKGLVQLFFHLTVIGCSGYLWARNFDNWSLGIPALVIYGFSLASMFAPMMNTYTQQLLLTIV